MSNTRRAPGSPNAGAGLVEAFIEDGMVILQLLPPDGDPVRLDLSGQEAHDLGMALVGGSYEVSKPSAWLRGKAEDGR